MYYKKWLVLPYIKSPQMFIRFYLIRQYGKWVLSLLNRSYFLYLWIWHNCMSSIEWQSCNSSCVTCILLKTCFCCTGHSWREILQQADLFRKVSQIHIGCILLSGKWPLINNGFCFLVYNSEPFCVNTLMYNMLHWVGWTNI